MIFKAFAKSFSPYYYLHPLWITGTQHLNVCEAALMITVHALSAQNPSEYRNQLCEQVPSGN